LKKLILRNNSLANEQGGKVLSTVLTTNSTLTELDVSDNWKGAGSGGPAKFAKELAVGLRDNAALSCPTGDNHFQAKKQFLKTTSTCKHCGHHEDKHIKVGLTCMHLQRKFQPDVLAVIFVTRGR